MASPEKPEVVTVCRRAHFNATHRLHNPNWSDEKNESVFGKCNNENYHGHNYNLVVKVTGPIDPETGYVIDLKVLNDIIMEHVVERYDHKNLYLDVEDFREVNPSAEYIAVAIWKIIREKLDPKFLIGIELFETERNSVCYSGPFNKFRVSRSGFLIPNS
jgi:6-pyruvoyltetrahydropterin/6-carboxytetrahydropterin synthase